MTSQRTMTTTLNTLLKQMKGFLNINILLTILMITIENPVNWALLAVI